VRWEKESLRLALRPAAVRTVRTERGESGGVRRLWRPLIETGDLRLAADLGAAVVAAAAAAVPELVLVVVVAFEDDVVGTLLAAVEMMLLLWKRDGDRMLAILHAIVDMFCGKLIRSSMIILLRSSSLVV
jgi:hypothetical protein